MTNRELTREIYWINLSNLLARTQLDELNLGWAGPEAVQWHPGSDAIQRLAHEDPATVREVLDAITCSNACRVDIAIIHSYMTSACLSACLQFSCLSIFLYLNVCLFFGLLCNYGCRYFPSCLPVRVLHSQRKHQSSSFKQPVNVGPYSSIIITTY